MYHITQAVIEAEARVNISNYSATPDDIVLTTISNFEKETEVKLNILGYALEHVEQKLQDEDVTGNVLEIKNNYIQTSDTAKLFKKSLEAIVANKVPVMDLTIVGNPLIKIGDKVRATSEMHKFDFTGIVKRSTLRYDGGLSGTMTLVNIAALGGM